MAFGLPPAGSLVEVLVGASSPAGTELGGLVSWTDTDDLPTTKRKYYMQPAIVSVGDSAKEFQAVCDYESGDSGQQIVFAARVAKANFFVGVAPDGAAGEELEVKVSHQEIAGPDSDGFSTINWTFSQQNAATLIGSGYGA